MKTDRELLELAAKAAGFKGQWDGGWFAMCDGENYWDPFRHNGQSLRLAVKLGMNVEVNLDDGCTRIRDEFGSLVLLNMFLDGDADAATRRSIVSAAAAIGESMK